MKVYILYINVGYDDPTGNFDLVKAIAPFHYAMVEPYKVMFLHFP
ncbi:MAG: hypothetical protein UV83_C0003G0082 [candidate division WWE3 bacterium GW2011_GWE2_43_18]|nr:hypothetical protein P147_WWE3C00001G0907 [candidate division WWE3 bacterium RAAC2_WWE3_1]KKS29482.1 MAG: hypothetical protein UU91_C0005G0014 [candidate division WWE3 bacterium GW2011_GWB1_42_117]KKS54911.1 MAG: hypothetical protein UV21_C0004G0076 [candidate division WWE3 bacterium GW2011_GWD2_42_34]KKT05527.1 MAG: hypothetical protein UV83_C0003G0082 [candidate division WWE3 bacterium GW2011_GWE2_43_18]KKT06719.1 MAG: hypothetical protein UV84_C0004G0007 [candidate division WWE3 bacterium